MTFSGARRSFIKYLMLIASLPILSKLPIPVYADDYKVKCDELNGKDRDRVVEKVLGSADYRNVSGMLLDRGLEPDIDKAAAAICRNRDGRKLLVSIPFHNGGFDGGVGVVTYEEAGYCNNALALYIEDNEVRDWRYSFEGEIREKIYTCSPEKDSDSTSTPRLTSYTCIDCPDGSQCCRECGPLDRPCCVCENMDQNCFIWCQAQCYIRCYSIPFYCAFLWYCLSNCGYQCCGGIYSCNCCSRGG